MVRLIALSVALPCVLSLSVPHPKRTAPSLRRSIRRVAQRGSVSTDSARDGITQKSATVKTAVLPEAEDVESLRVKVDGTWYEVGQWAARHPGGRHMLRWVDGFDVSMLFHSIHVFSKSSALAILKQMPEADVTVDPPQTLPSIQPVPLDQMQATFEDRLLRRKLLSNATVNAEAIAAAPPPPPLKLDIFAATKAKLQDAMSVGTNIYESPLQKDLEAMLHRHFKRPAEYKATNMHWVRIFASAALTAFCFVGYLKGSVASTLVLPWVSWLLFSGAVHEGTHSTLSTKPLVNKLAMFAAHPFILNVFCWFPQHQISHHQFTNDEKYDVDLHHLRPARLHQNTDLDKEATGYNFLLKGLFTTLGMAVLWPLRTLLDRPTPRYHNNVTPIPKAISKRQLLASMVPTFFVLIYPWLLALAGKVCLLRALFMFLYPWNVTSGIWTVLTQSSHIQEECQRPPAEDGDFYQWQIESALDYSVTNKFVPMMTAGLNYQSMHHALPSVCSCHFHKLYPEYKAICEKHGVRLNTRPNIAAAWKSCVQRVFQLSSPTGAVPGWLRFAPF